MKREEFDKWLKRHGEAFPGLADWVKSKGGRSVADRWFGVLKLTDFDAACEATDRMLGDAESVNANYTSHPAIVRKLCSGQSHYRSREFSEGCMCKGTGFVEVLNDRVFKTPDGNLITADTVTVLCKCPEGQWKLDHQGGPRLGGGEHPRMLMFDGSMRIWGVKYDETEPLSSKPSPSFGFDSLPEFQPDLYEPKGVDD